MNRPLRFLFPLAACLSLVSFAAAAEMGNPAAQHFRTGLAYERLGRYEDAYTELQLASNLDPHDPQIAVALGVLANRLSRIDEAQRALEHSIALDANSCASYYALALIYEKKGLADRALESWQRFVGLTQDEALKNIGRKHIAYLQARV
jgi:tetratricopeptide (TPR) repeat protein